MPEQRKAPRRSARISVRCQTAEKKMQGSLSDISTGGALLQVPEDTPSGSRVSLQVDLPIFPEPLFIRGTVIGKHSDQGVGVRFDPLSDDQRRLLNLLFWG
jgi:hypothetical protein